MEDFVMASRRQRNNVDGEMTNGLVDDEKIRGVMQTIESWEYTELLRLRELIDEEYKRKAAQARTAVIEETQRKFAQLGLSFDEVAAMQKQRKRAPRKPAAPKYRSPDDKEWNGRGATPKWIRQIEEGGGNRNDYLIKEEDNGAQTLL